MATGTLERLPRQERIGPCSLVLHQVIHNGYFGKVYIAEQERGENSWERVCVKKNNAAFADTGDDSIEIQRQQQRCHDEICALLRGKQHPFIVDLLEYEIRGGGETWVVMEFCAFGDMEEFLKARSLKLENELIQNIMNNTSSALEFLHSQSPPIIHRDIKLKNIFVQGIDRNFVFKLGDFGLAKLVPEGITLHGFNMDTLAGTQYFMAPEFYLENLNYDSSIDIFALGLVYLVILIFDGQLEQLRPCSGKDEYAYFKDGKNPGVKLLVKAVLES